MCPGCVAAFQDQRAKTHLRQDQPGEQATGAAADHHRSRRQGGGRRPGHEAVGGIRRRPDMAVAAQPFEYRCLVVHLDIQRVDESDRRRFARVVAAAADRVARVVEREFEFGESHCRIAAGGGEKADILSFRGALPPAAGGVSGSFSAGCGKSRRPRYGDPGRRSGEAVARRPPMEPEQRGRQRGHGDDGQGVGVEAGPAGAGDQYAR